MPPMLIPRPLKPTVSGSACDEVYENTHIERINGTIKNQYLERMATKSYEELKKRLSQVIDTYNNHRPHQSLNKMTPFAYEHL